MKKKVIQIGIIALLHFGCSSDKIFKIENSVWYNDKIDNCTSKIRVGANGECALYYCGINQSFDGEYEINNDTLVIKEYHLVSEAPMDKGIKEIRFEYKYILEDEKLWMVEYRDLKSNYERIGRDSLFVFERVSDL